jgi:hypothetical protein
MRWLAISALLGCAEVRPPPPAPIVTLAPEPAPPPACITPPETATPITHAYGDTTRVMYCVGDACFALELGTGKLQHLRDAPTAPPHAARVEATNPKLDVCTGDNCTPLTGKIMPGTTPIHATTNVAGTIAVVLLGDALAGRGYAEVWDVVAGKRLAQFPYARGEFRCGEVAMLGDTIYVSASTCSSPSARGSLFAQRGSKIANVGKGDFGTYGGATAQLDATTWAFLEESGNRLAIQDVVHGRLKKTIDTSELWGGKDAMGNPGESTVISLGGGTLAVIAGSPANGSVAIVDVATGKLEITRAPLCR